MKAFRRSLVAIAAAAAVAVGAVVFLITQPASAITGGEPDENRHPNVGLILFYTPEGRFRCSATLISPTVLVTAAHCTVDTVGQTLVTFNSVIAEQAPSGFPVAGDVAGGYSEAELTAAGYLSGTAHTHPAYSNFTDLDNWNDVGVIVLNSAASLTPAPLTGPDVLSAYEQPRLNKTDFDLVGYGTEVRKPTAGPQKPEPMSFPLIRRFTTSPGQKLTPQILQLNGNPNDTRGGGGTCFGDSGGPVILDGAVVAVTSYGYTDNCRYLGGYQRIDIAGVQTWLHTFI